MSLIPAALGLSCYGLASPFVGERFIENYGPDLCDVVHLPRASGGELTVGVTSRATIFPGPGLPRTAISEDMAREDVALTLVGRVISVDEDYSSIGAEVAHEDGAWTSNEMMIGGEVLSGYEREYREMWIAYCLSPTLIFHVLGPTKLRLNRIALRKLRPGEARVREVSPQ